MSAVLERTQTNVRIVAVEPFPMAEWNPQSPKITAELGGTATTTPDMQFQWNNCVGEARLANRAAIALKSLDAGSTILNLGTEVIRKKYGEDLAARNISVVDISSDAYQTVLEEGKRFDMAFGNMDTAFDLHKAFADVHNALKPGADMYIDIYDNPANAPQYIEDTLDDVMRRAGFYVQVTHHIEGKTDSRWEVQGIALEPVDPNNLPYKMKPKYFKTGQEWETRIAYPEFFYENEGREFPV